MLPTGCYDRNSRVLDNLCDTVICRAGKHKLAGRTKICIQLSIQSPKVKQIISFNIFTYIYIYVI
jgi:hypothetical protein